MKRIAGSVRSVKNRSGDQSIRRTREYWMIYRGQGFLSGLDFYMSLWIRRLYYTSGTQIRICGQNLHLSARFWSFVKSYCWYKMSGQRRMILFGILRSCYWHRYPKNYFKRNQVFFSVPYGMWVMWLVNVLLNVGQFILFYILYLYIFYLFYLYLFILDIFIFYILYIFIFQVEIVTHIGPARRLWMGPQFSFRKRDINPM